MMYVCIFLCLCVQKIINSYLYEKDFTLYVKFIIAVYVGYIYGAQ